MVLLRLEGSLSKGDDGVGGAEDRQLLPAVVPFPLEALDGMAAYMKHALSSQKSQ